MKNITPVVVLISVYKYSWLSIGVLGGVIFERLYSMPGGTRRVFPEQGGWNPLGSKVYLSYGVSGDLIQLG